MKKFLSLALALVLTMSLVIISAGAKDFTDDSKINYKEAVDVISAVGIVDGYEDGTFNPNATLTRGAAAKIITNMILGPTTAGALTADAAPFKDVPASHTFAGQIAYCASQGIINGYGDGSFRPAGTVTGYQFMKMLLGALGYDGKIEGYTGDNWSVNVAKRAGNVGLKDGNDSFVGSKAMTREEACLYAFNALKATMVEYENKGSNITINGVEFVQGASAAKDVENKKNVETIKNDDKMQFAEQYFSNLRLTSGDSDAFERPANTWTYKSNSVGTYAKTADLSYTTGVKVGTIYSDLGLAKAIDDTDTKVYEDGVINSTWDKLDIVRGGSDKIGGNGALTEVYYNDNDGTVEITVVNTYVGDVTATKAATSSKDAYITVAPRLAGATAGNFETDTDFSVDDVVLYTYSNKKNDDGVKSVEPAEVLDGKVTAFTTGKKVSLDGTSYDYAVKVANEAKSADKNYDVKLVLDSYGYAIDVDTKNTVTNYAVVLKYNAKGGTYATDPVAQLLLTDGTVKDVSLTAAMETAPDKGQIVTYRVNNKDKYTLTAVGEVATDKTGYIVKNGESSSLVDLGTVTMANGKTVFLIATKGTDGTVYTVYTGIKNVPTVNASQAGIVASAAKGDSASAAVVFIDATANATVSNSSKDVIFVKFSSSVKVTSDSEKGEYFTYDAIVNGEITTIDVAAKDDGTSPVTESTLYTSVSYDANNVATLAGAVDGTDTDIGVLADGTKKADSDVVGLGFADTTYYTYASDCQVFVVDGDGNITTSSVRAIADNETNKVYAKVTDGELTTIVIVEPAGKPEDVNKDATVKSVELASNGTITLTLTGSVTEEKTYEATVYKYMETTDKFMAAGKVDVTVSADAETGNGTATLSSGGIYYVVVGGVQSDNVTAQ